MKTYRKGADEALRVTINWGPDLRVGESISASDYTFPSGITEGTSTFSERQTSVIVSGGTINTTYTVENQITTDYGSLDQTLEKSFKVQIVDK